MNRIFLVGFMGAGKTTVGRQLGALLGWDFRDLDEIISQQERRSIGDIFRWSGEAYFREQEHSLLVSLVRTPRLVVATGGGTYVADQNRGLIEASGWSVWIQVSFLEALRRCAAGTTRPLLNKEVSLEMLFRQREEYYRNARTWVNSENAAPEEVARRILELLREEGLAVGPA